MGCGRVGAFVSRSLDELGHEVSVIDCNPQAFSRLGVDFNGRTTVGIGFDRTVLVKAGIEKADAFIAVTNGDNSNIIATRVVREQFGIDNVVARIYDQQRAEVYEKMGIATVASVLWSSQQVLNRIHPDRIALSWLDSSGQIGLRQINVHSDWVGKKVAVIEQLTSTRVAAILRCGKPLDIRPDTVYQSGDQLFFCAPVNTLKDGYETLTHGPQEN